MIENAARAWACDGWLPRGCRRRAGWRSGVLDLAARGAWFGCLIEAPSPDVYYLSRMLGHASIQETVDTYGRWLAANRRGALDVLDDAPAVDTGSSQSATNLQPTA